MRYGNRTRLGADISGWLPEQSFNPSYLDGLIAWWDAADSTTFTYSSGTVVSQWNDKSGNGYHFSQGTLSKQPSRSGSMNGKATVVFDGSNDSMSTISTVDMAPGQQISVAVVFSSVENADQSFLEQTSNYNNNAGSFRFARNATNTIGFGKRGVSLYSAYNNALLVGTEPIVAIAIHDGTLTTSESWVGVNDFLPNNVVVNNNTNSDNINSTIFLASRNNSSIFLNGEIAEIIVTRSAWSRNTRIDVQNYLATKWGVTL
jgi:hypothetical protein